MKTIKLTVLDVKLGAIYNDNEDCPLATAAKRQFPKTKEISAGCFSIRIDDIDYELDHPYHFDDYNEDILRLGDNNKEVLRTFKLIEKIWVLKKHNVHFSHNNKL